jgi:hypothetical protein
VAKKKSSKKKAASLPSPIPGEYDLRLGAEAESDAEFTAFVITVLCHAVNPSIDRVLAYPIVLEMIEGGLGEDNAEIYGHLIRNTAQAENKDPH